MRIIPIVSSVLAMAMVGIALAFSCYRGGRVKDCLAKLWSGRGREILHLEIDNGFFFFMDLLIRYSQRLLWASAILVLLLSIASPASLPSTAIVVSLAFAGHAGAIWFMAHHRVKVFRGMLASDGYGSYGQACTDWCSREKSVRPQLFAAMGVVLTAIYILCAGA